LRPLCKQPAPSRPRAPAPPHPCALRPCGDAAMHPCALAATPHLRSQVSHWPLPPQLPPPGRAGEAHMNHCVHESPVFRHFMHTILAVSTTSARFAWGWPGSGSYSARVSARDWIACAIAVPAIRRDRDRSRESSAAAQPPMRPDADKTRIARGRGRRVKICVTSQNGPFTLAEQLPGQRRPTAAMAWVLLRPLSFA
jgi:hypothetical protein